MLIILGTHRGNPKTEYTVKRVYLPFIYRLFFFDT